MFKFEEVAKKIGQPIVIEGFVSAVRIQSKMAFVVLESGPHKVQCVCFGQACAAAGELMQHGYARVEGVVAAVPQAPGGFEIKASHVELVSGAPAASWPIGPESEIGKKLEWPVARFRERKEQIILSASSELEFQMVSFLRSKGFVGIHTPKIVGTPSESGSEVFKLKYFGKEAYLAMSPQLAKQMAVLGGLGKVYEVGAVYRAQKSTTKKHSAEFVGVDLEIEGVKSELELVEIESQMLFHAMEMTLQVMGPELTAAYPKATLPKPAHVMTFAQAEEVLGISGGEALTSEQESELGEIMEGRGFELLAITQVPWKQRPFYHMREGAELTRSFEMIYRGIEITSGSVREHRHPVLMRQLVEKGLTGKGMEFYLESFKLGAPPHGGFGLGLARVVMLFLGLASIKEATFIHRGPGRLTP